MSTKAKQDAARETIESMNVWRGR